jgi:hypothetical protein
MSPHYPSSRSLVAALTSLIVCQPLAFATPLVSQPDQRALVDVNDSRPLASAVEILEQRYGWVITYEDPPYLYPPDISDVTAQVRRDRASDRRVLVPKGGSFQFAYAPPGVSSPTEAARILKALLEEYNGSGNPGAFRLVQTATTFHVVPSAASNAQGLSQPTSSLLDTMISVGAEERTALQMLDAIVQALGRTTGAKIWLGSAPLNLMVQTRIQGTAAKASARTLLMQVLENTGRRLSWQLLCAPGPVRDCALNVYEVRKTAAQ